MSSAVRKPLTLDEFLAWECEQELRHEFDGFQPAAMAGGTAAHAAIQRNLAIAVGGRLRGSLCQFYGSDLKILAAGSVRYPDGTVVCSPVARDATLVNNPTVVFEVLSESTARTDLVTKNQEYAATASVRRYIALAQDGIAGTMFERVGTDWVGHLLNADSILHMPEIGIELALVELYDGVDLATTAPAAEAPSRPSP